MFELSNYLVGIYKVDDCTDSVTLVNHPPDALPPATQPHISLTQPADETMRPTINGESQPQPLRPTDNFRSVGGAEATFAPHLESTALSLAVEEASESIVSPMPSQQISTAAAI